MIPGVDPKTLAELEEALDAVRSDLSSRASTPEECARARAVLLELAENEDVDNETRCEAAASVLWGGE